MKRKGTLSVQGKGIGALLFGLMIFVFGCQDPLSLATEKAVEDDSPITDTENETTEIELPAAEICWVLPMDFVTINDIEESEDGALIVGGHLKYVDIPEEGQETVFGRGEPGETALTVTDEYDENIGFVAKYNPDRTLAWAVGGIPDVGSVIATADGGAMAMVVVLGFKTTFVRISSDGELEGQYIFDGMGTLTTDGDFVVAGNYLESVELGEGDNTVLLETEEESGAYLARYDCDQNLVWAKPLSPSVVPNRVTAADNGWIAITDASGTTTAAWSENEIDEEATSSLILFNEEGDELWRRLAKGPLIEYGKVRVAFTSNNTLVWTGEFSYDLTFTDDLGHTVTLSAPHGSGPPGASWGTILPFMTVYSPEGELLSATTSLGYKSVLDNNGGIITINPRNSEEYELSEILVCPDDLCSNLVLGRFNLDGTLDWLREVDFGVPVWSSFLGRGTNFEVLEDDSMLLVAFLDDGLAGQSYPLHNERGTAIVNICPIDSP